MKMRFVIGLGLVTCLYAGLTAAAGIDAQLTALGFEEHPVPAGDALSRANRVRESFIVRVADNRLVVNNHDYASRDSGTPLVIYRVGSIRYEGTHRGEWGGELTAIFPGGKRHILLNKGIVAMLPGETHPQVYTGLAHLGLREGAVYRVRSADRDPRVERIAVLPDAPVVVINDPRNKHLGTKIVVGSASLIISGRHGQEDYVKVLAREQFWWPLFPTSAVIVDDHLVIGMRSGLAVVRLEGSSVRSIRYFVPRARKAGT